MCFKQEGVPWKQNNVSSLKHTIKEVGIRLTNVLCDCPNNNIEVSAQVNILTSQLSSKKLGSVVGHLILLSTLLNDLLNEERIQPINHGNAVNVADCRWSWQCSCGIVLVKRRRPQTPKILLLFQYFVVLTHTVEAEKLRLSLADLWRHQMSYL